MHGALCEPCDAGKIYGSAFNISESDTRPQRVCSGTMYLHVLQPQDAGAEYGGDSKGPYPLHVHAHVTALDELTLNPLVKAVYFPVSYALDLESRERARSDQMRSMFSVLSLLPGLQSHNSPTDG